MTNFQLKHELRKLRNITPNRSWQTARRELLLQQIRAQVNVPETAPTLSERLRTWADLLSAGFSGTLSAVAARGVAMALLLVTLVLGSGGYVLAAADRSLPGDSLYRVKLAMEDARLSAARSPKDRIELQVEFAARRLDELNKLARLSGRETEIASAFSQFETSISGVASAVSAIDRSASADDRIAAARIVDERLASYQHTLESASAEHANPETVRNVGKALATVSKVSTQTLRVIAEAPSVPKEEVAKKIDDKIRLAEETLKKADAKLAGGTKGDVVADKAKNQSSDAKENLAVAKKKVVEGDYTAALNILESVEDMVSEVATSAEAVVSGETKVDDVEKPAEGAGEVKAQAEEGGVAQ